VRDLKASNAMILGMIGELVKETAREDERLAAIEAQVERIERRLELSDSP